MNTRRHRSFRPTLDVLPVRIAPSGGVTPAAVVATPTLAPLPSCYNILISNSNNWTLASPSPAVHPA
jgi:hypothetical protein